MYASRLHLFGTVHVKYYWFQNMDMRSPSLGPSEITFVRQYHELIFLKGFL